MRQKIPPARIHEITMPPSLILCRAFGLFLAASFVGLLCVSGCSQNQTAIASLENAQSLTLYSIDGRDYEGRDAEKPMTDESIHGFPVVGKVEIKDAAKRKELIAALKKGIEQKDIAMAKCFWPRHAIRVVENGKSIDYVICFQCKQLELWTGETKKVIPCSDDPKQSFNQILKDANVTIVPDGKPGNEKK